jgi:hypothetical protein
MNTSDLIDRDYIEADVIIDDTDKTKTKIKRTLSYIEQARQTNNLSKSDKLGFLAGGALAVSSITFLTVLALIPFLFVIASKPAPVLVQTADGKSMKVMALEGNQRSPQVIKDSVTIMLSKLFTWRNFLTPINSEELVNPKPDPGIAIPARNGFLGGKIPTEVWQATFSLSPDFQTSYLYVLAKMVSDAGIYNTSGGAQVSLELRDVGNPISVGDGTWRVPIVADLTKLDAVTKLPTRVQFNKDIFVQAVPVPHIREEGTVLQKSLSQMTAEAKASGLQIYAMRDSERPELMPGTRKSVKPSPSPSAEASPPAQLTQ